MQIVTVYNNKDCYDLNIAMNKVMQCHELIGYDNRKSNIPITVRYNNFIRTKLKDNSWVIFCHQDFSFLENPEYILEKTNRHFIYGVTGTKLFKNSFIAFIKKYLPLNNWKLYGQILQGRNNKKPYRHGIFVREPKEVDTVDCCCIIVHGWLIKKYNLLFDEKLDFHLYSEDLCIAAKQKYGIKTKVLQMKCRHMSEGDYSKSFEKSAGYLREKYPGIEFSSTAYDFSF